MRQLKGQRWAPMLMAIAMVVAMMGWGCSSGPSVPDASPMPEGEDYSGMWYSEQFEHMFLKQEGDEVVGVYTYQGGGSIEGRVEGNLLLFDWYEPGDRQRARRSMEGKGYFQLRGGQEGPELEGQWGYRGDRQGAGPWNAEWIRDLEDRDPLDLSALSGN